LYLTKLQNLFSTTDVPDSAADLFEKNIDSLYAYARKRVQSEDDIMDVLQDTFVAYLESVANFKGLSSPLTYLTGILRNQIFNLYRRQNREFSLADEDLALLLQEKRPATPQENSPTSSALETSDTHQVLADCIRRLPHPYHTAFILREIEELPTDEICNILSVSVTNLNVILHRARQKLRQMLVAEGIKNEIGH
jgi:RNA polymerase sigma factor (sigma-70 family)